MTGFKVLLASTLMLHDATGASDGLVMRLSGSSGTDTGSEGRRSRSNSSSSVRGRIPHQNENDATTEIWQQWPRTDGVEGSYYVNGNDSRFEAPRYSWIQQQDKFWNQQYASSGWVTWREKCNMDLLRSVASSGARYCDEVIAEIQKAGFTLQYDLYRAGTHKEVIKVVNSSSGAVCVAKISHKKAHVRDHRKELDFKERLRIKDFIVPSLRVVSFTLSNREPVLIEFQPLGQPLDEAGYRTDKLDDLQDAIEAKGYNIPDFGPANVAKIDGRLLVHDLGMLTGA